MLFSTLNYELRSHAAYDRKAPRIADLVESFRGGSSCGQAAQCSCSSIPHRGSFMAQESQQAPTGAHLVEGLRGGGSCGQAAQCSCSSVPHRGSFMAQESQALPQRLVPCSACVQQAMSQLTSSFVQVKSSLLAEVACAIRRSFVAQQSQALPQRLVTCSACVQPMSQPTSTCSIIASADREICRMQQHTASARQGRTNVREAPWRSC